jgi:hypothetical protein
MHVSDLEGIEDFLNENPKRIWELLEYNFKDRRFIPAFHNSVNHIVKNLSHPERVLNLLYQLVKKYDPEENTVNWSPHPSQKPKSVPQSSGPA